MPDDGLIDIGDLADRTGLTPSAMRYYEKRGLITPAARHGLRRRYSPEVLDRLLVITTAQRAGFSLAEIGTLIDADTDDTALRKQLAAHVTRLDDQISHLIATRDGLRHALRCPHRPLSSCPTFVSFIRSRAGFGAAETKQ